MAEKKKPSLAGKIMDSLLSDDAAKAKVRPDDALSSSPKGGEKPSADKKQKLYIAGEESRPDYNLDLEGEPHAEAGPSNQDSSDEPDLDVFGGSSDERPEPSPAPEPSVPDAMVSADESKYDKQEPEPQSSPEEPEKNESDFAGKDFQPDTAEFLRDGNFKNDTVPSDPKLQDDDLFTRPVGLDKTKYIEQEIKPQDATQPKPAGDETLRLPGMDKPQEHSSEDSSGDSDVAVRVGAGHFFEKQVRGSQSAEASLAQSESLRIAQSRIKELEAEVEKLRRENDSLGSAAELLRRRSEEMKSLVEKAERERSRVQESIKEEKQVYKASISAKERELTELRDKVDELEMRLENDFKKIRVRERDLEHRLELVQMENTSVVRAKDEAILDLKRKIDQLTVEAENYRIKGQELYKKLDEKQEVERRVVRALRIALSIFEVDGDNESESEITEDSVASLRKAE